MTHSTRNPATQAASIPALIGTLRNHFNRGLTKPLAYRLQQLDGLLRFLNERENEIFAALKSDLNKCQVESLGSEINMVANDIKFIKKNLPKWMKPKKVATSMMAQPGQSYIYSEPLGIVLIIAPWNYPLMLTLSPLVGAIAAGNCVALKPSEIAPVTSQLLANELPKYLDTHSICIIEGGVAETTALLAEKFDHILYTGNGNVGKIVMTAAAKHLTPVTLELGGKSPCIVGASTNLDVAARRIAWGKFTNAGQTCIAPDYVLVEAAVEKEFLEKLKINIHAFYGDHPETSPDYGRIINTHHYQRLMKLLTGSGDIYIGGNGNEEDRYIAPTVLYHLPENAPVMTDEIFGPILPVIPVATLDAAIAYINARPKPLSLYLFTSESETRNRVIAETSSGSIGVNFPLLQVAVEDLPFGGVGPSGMGAYHGKYSFATFSHFKSVLIKPTWFDLSLIYPPYSKRFLKLLRWL